MARRTVGKPSGIGSDFFESYAAERGFSILRGPCGLVPDMGALRGPDFDPAAVAPEVTDFYERTSAYELDAWSHWCGAFRPFGSALAVLFSRRLQQLNVPLSGLDTSRGMTSEVARLAERHTQTTVWTTWVRRLVGTGHVIYAGAYSTCRVPDFAGSCVRVVFPLPNGNAVVVMRPVAHADGSLSLVSSGERFGGPGFYFTVCGRRGSWGRYVRSFRERIHVYPHGNDVRADHVFTIWGATFLRLHYRLRRRAAD